MIVVKIPGLIILRIGRLDRKNWRLRVFAYFLCCTIKNSPCDKNILSAQNWSKYVARVSVDDNRELQGSSGENIEKNTPRFEPTANC